MAEYNPSYYVNIPASVRYDKRLTPKAILLYGEITALTNKKGYCWASNSYFAELYGVDNSTIQRWLKSLEDGNHIRRDVKFKPGTSIVDKRAIRIQPMSFEDEDPTAELRSPHLKNEVTPPQKYGGPHLKNEQENNTFNNTTNNNTNNNDSKKSPINLWQDVYGSLNAIQMEDLLTYQQELGEELVIEAINRTAIAITSNSRGGAFTYMRRILDSWQNAGVKTMADVEKQDKIFDQGKSVKRTAYKPKTKVREIATDWSKKEAPKSNISDEEIQRLIDDLENAGGNDKNDK